MCMGIPMQVLACRHGRAECRNPLRAGELEDVDLSLVGPVVADDWLLVFAGAAREVLAAGQADEILQALTALDAAMRGTFDPALHLTDLTQREPQLPPHLQSLLDAQRETLQ